MWSSLWEGVCHWSDARCPVGLASQFGNSSLAGVPNRRLLIVHLTKLDTRLSIMLVHRPPLCLILFLPLIEIS